MELPFSEQEAELQRFLAENLVLKKMEEIVAKKAAKDANDEAERILKQARADERARQRELKLPYQNKPNQKTM